MKHIVALTPIMIRELNRILRKQNPEDFDLWDTCVCPENNALKCRFVGTVGATDTNVCAVSDSSAKFLIALIDCEYPEAGDHTWDYENEIVIPVMRTGEKPCSLQAFLNKYLGGVK